MRKRFVSIWFPQLATDWFAAKQPQLKKAVFVLKGSLRGCMIITAASPEARAKGVFVGMNLADARAAIPSLRVLDDKVGLATQLLQRIAEWCIRFTPCAATDLPDGILLDATGYTHLWGNEEAYITGIINRLAARGYTTRVAIADTIGAAWAVARFGKEAAVIESGDQFQALCGLPPSALRLPEETVEQLHKLGLHTVKDFIAMPRTALRRRFGPLILQRIAQALGEEEEIFAPIFPQQPYAEHLPSIEPIVTLTGIEIGLDRLLGPLCNRLRTEGKGLRTAYFRCYRTDGGAQGIEIGTSRPSHNEQHLFHLFRLKLSSLEPKDGIELFVLEATKVEDCATLQDAFWKTNLGLQDVQVAELLDRLSGRLGAQNIQRFLPVEHHLPERSVKQAVSLDEATRTEWRADKARPLQLLPTPETIEVTAPVPDYPPMNFRYNGELHTVAKADGPERIEQEWWVQEGEHRDYYCVEDEKGQRYWLFRLGHYEEEKKPQWYLHGFFA